MSGRKTALVTGAARRVGREISLHLARAGWDIAAHYHRSEAEAKALRHDIEALGQRAALLPHNLDGQAAQAGEIVRRAAETLGGVDLLVLNASHFEKDAIGTLRPEALRAHLAVHLESSLFLIQAFAALPPREENPPPRNIVALLDGMRGWSMSPAFLSYTLSKEALTAAVRLLAPPLAPGIRINGVALGPTLPGPMDTPASFPRHAERSLLGRTSSPAEVCDALDFILAAPSLSGQVIDLGAAATAPRSSPRV